ncbi:hypothetical protein CVIRNUC_004906 [Coccomyxa viridis]|uniref:Uncharacterized protein n=1 Tax=Coccomyxa viridis TaxID=1274662 RepID=A0AAV1I334_9CHLO|nr:hypothetical protein CVIRNUC_004906 [Coccomyxa viridis]
MSEKSQVGPQQIEVVVNGKQRGNDLSILSYDHEWEYAVFGEDGIPEDLRGKLRVAGYRFCGLRCITTVRGVLANGEPFVWKARRHRKGRGVGGKFVKRPVSPFAWLDPLPFLHGGALTAVRYCSALLLMLGASIFSFSNAVQISPSIQPRSMSEKQPYEGYQLYDWLGSTPALAGLTTVAFGTYLKVVEANNTDHEWRMHVWREHGCSGPMPNFRWIAFRPDVIGWWGSCLRLVGATLMGTGSIVNFINQTAHVAMSPTLLYWIMYLPYILGPAFLLSGCMVLTLESSDPWYSGFFPYRRHHWHDLTFWITFLAQTGALGLLVGGVCQWHKQNILDESGMWAVQVFRALAYLFFGSLLLDISSFLSLVEISNPQI